MSWIRNQSDDASSDTEKVASEPNYNRDMNSPPMPTSQAQPATGNATLGQSIQIDGTLTGNEDLVIHGKVTGQVKLNGHSLTVGSNGKIEAGVYAKSVIVEGDVKGNITADDKIQITRSGSVAGDLKAPRIALDDGARFAGSVDMGAAKEAGTARETKSEYATVKR